MIAIGLLTATGPLFIAMFLFFETRGLFVGWVRALAACAFGLLSAWSLTVLMLHAVDPWLDALADVGANGLADARTGITAAIIVLVFCAAQLGLMLAGIMIARGFRLPSRAPRAASQTMAHQAMPASTPLDLISRPARLAELLAHQDTAAIYGERTLATATSVTHARREGSSPGAAVRNTHWRFLSPPSCQAGRTARVKKPLAAILSAALLFAATPSEGALVPRPGSGDPRIFVVDYDPTQVVELNATMGYQTFIEFSADERYRKCRGGRCHRLADHA